MNEKMQMYMIGPNAQLAISEQHKFALDEFVSNVIKATGATLSSKIWPYRLGGTEYVSLEIEGTAGAINLTITICGECSLPSTHDVCRARDPVVLVCDSVDAFYLVNSILTGLRNSGSRST